MILYRVSSNNEENRKIRSKFALNIKKNQTYVWIISAIAGVLAIFLVSITFLILKSLKKKLKN